MTQSLTKECRSNVISADHSLQRTSPQLNGETGAESLIRSSLRSNEAHPSLNPSFSIAPATRRLDDVPIPLRPAFESKYKSDYEILKAIEQRIRQRQLGRTVE
jgi:hypothetical protein